MTIKLLLTCIKIILCRILDVSCGTIRTMLTVKEKTLFSAIAGFVEVFLWFVVARDALSNDGPTLVIGAAYATGYACGTFIGGKLAKALIAGNVAVQVITSSRDESVVAAIREKGYGISVLNVNSSEFAGEKYMILANIDKKNIGEFKDLIISLDEKAFLLIQDTKSYTGGYMRPGK